jgi:ADP-ribosylation factor GTPase-activating protein 2/3
MGVHTTFVRSVDLDEWTLRQVDAMRLGGNAAARTFFRAHGTTELQGQMDKKYTSKAAQLYKIELLKKVESLAVQRGEGVAAAAVQLAATSLSSDAATDDQAVARQKVVAARMSQPVQAKATLASQLPGASKLTTPPSSGGLVSLRKPAGAASKNYFKKKSSSGGLGGPSKLRANKLSMAKPLVGGDAKDGDDDLNAFDKVEEEPAVPVAAPVEAEAPPPTPSPVVPPEPTPSPNTEAKQKISMDEGVARMKMMNSDFFGGI